MYIFNLSKYIILNYDDKYLILQFFKQNSVDKQFYTAIIMSILNIT